MVQTPFVVSIILSPVAFDPEAQERTRRTAEKIVSLRGGSSLRSDHSETPKWFDEYLPVLGCGCCDLVPFFTQHVGVYATFRGPVKGEDEPLVWQADGLSRI